MKQIFKINYLKETRIEKIFVFFGRNYTDDSFEMFDSGNKKGSFKTNIESLTQLFKDNSNDNFFQDKQFFIQNYY